jgi:hypothetical protein
MECMSAREATGIASLRVTNAEADEHATRTEPNLQQQLGEVEDEM